MVLNQDATIAYIHCGIQNKYTHIKHAHTDNVSNRKGRKKKHTKLKTVFILFFIQHQRDSGN